MGLAACPKMLLTNSLSALGHIPEEPRPHSHQDRNLKSCFRTRV